MRAATPEAALKHPVWSMGAKISIDSATMMNKGLEVIEAFRLFRLPEQRIDVLFHPAVGDYGMVCYARRKRARAAGQPGHRIPIAHTLAWPERLPLPRRASIWRRWAGLSSSRRYRALSCAGSVPEALRSAAAGQPLSARRMKWRSGILSRRFGSWISSRRQPMCWTRWARRRPTRWTRSLRWIRRRGASQCASRQAARHDSFAGLKWDREAVDSTLSRPAPHGHRLRRGAGHPGIHPRIGPLRGTRWRGVLVETFSIGFGQAWRLGATALVPFGKSLDSPWRIRAAAWAAARRGHRAGEQPSADPGPHTRRNPFSHADHHRRGPAADFVLAIVLFAGLLACRPPGHAAGGQSGSARLGAALAGVQPGDRIEAMNGKSIATFGDLQEFVTPHADQPVQVTILRDGRQICYR